MNIMKFTKAFIKNATLSVLCLLVIICSAGCSKIITSDAPPTEITDCNYNNELNFFSNSFEDKIRFYSMENGTTTEADVFTFNETLSHKDLNYKINFAYSKVDGNIVFTDLQKKENDAYFLKAADEHNRSIFICVNTVRNNFYPYLYDTKTNAVRDIFEGTGFDDLWTEDFKMNSNFKKALLFCSSPEKVYLCDTSEKSLSDMTILTGIENITSAVWTIDNNILLFEEKESDTVTVWHYNTTNGKCKLISDDYILYTDELGYGLKLFESQYAVNITENGKIQAVDLTKGSSKNIKGITYNSNTYIDTQIHERGKMLLIGMNDPSENRSVLLINLEEGRITKQRTIASDLTNISYYNANYIIAYSQEGNYSLYYLGENK